MSRYIDADEFMSKFVNEFWGAGISFSSVDDIIEKLVKKAGDVSPVTHAHWVKLTSDGHVLGCSNCKYEIYNEIYYPDDLQKYCSECGAKMDEKGEKID